jgi:hypothetical protein
MDGKQSLYHIKTLLSLEKTYQKVCITIKVCLHYTTIHFPGRVVGQKISNFDNIFSIYI